MSDEKPKATVVSMCGRPIEAPEEDGADPEAAAAKRQLTHWANEATAYVGLFVTPDGISLASSADDPGRVLALATLLKSRAETFAINCLCEDEGVELEGEYEDD